MTKLLSNICKSHNIKTMTYAESNRLIEVLGIDDYVKCYDGFCLEIPGTVSTPTILFNGRLSENIQNAVIAHELGHIILGHTTNKQNNTHCKTVCEYEYSELIADIFSAVLMAINLLKESA